MGHQIGVFFCERFLCTESRFGFAYFQCGKSYLYQLAEGEFADSERCEASLGNAIVGYFSRCSCKGAGEVFRKASRCSKTEKSRENVIWRTLESWENRKSEKRHQKGKSESTSIWWENGKVLKKTPGCGENILISKQGLRGGEKERKRKNPGKEEKVPRNENESWKKKRNTIFGCTKNRKNIKDTNREKTITVTWIYQIWGEA